MLNHHVVTYIDKDGVTHKASFDETTMARIPAGAKIISIDKQELKTLSNESAKNCKVLKVTIET